MNWHATTPYSIASGDYAISRAVVLDLETGELVDRYSVWFGLDLLQQPRDRARPAQLLGVRASAVEAKALCAFHCAANQAG